MQSLPSNCPICDGEIIVTRLYCRDCDSTIEGRFLAGHFENLTPEQLSFIETFVRCEGKITRVEEDMGLSYPAVRARLNELIRALELDESKVKRSLDEHGMQRIEGELVTIYLPPGEILQEIDLNDLLFDMHAEVYDKIPVGSLCWMDETRLELGRQICASTSAGRPVVIEAGFGTNTQPRGENPFRNTLADLFNRLEEAGVDAGQVKWILIESSYETRAERNRRRKTRDERDDKSIPQSDRYGCRSPDHAGNGPGGGPN